MSKYKWLLLSVTAFCTWGCYAPMGFHEVDYDSGTNPFAKIRVLNDQGHLEVIISDDSRDVRQLRVTDAKYFDSAEKYLPTTLVAGGISHEGGTGQGKEVFWFTINFTNDRQFERPAFYLKIRGFYGAEPFVVDAKFTDQVHYQMVNIMDALDHG